MDEESASPELGKESACPKDLVSQACKCLASVSHGGAPHVWTFVGHAALAAFLEIVWGRTHVWTFAGHTAVVAFWKSFEVNPCVDLSCHTAHGGS